ncbi:MAG: TerC family protein [Chloroherpetonaceae bacterium]|nr:TerC family protein [Chloroherpetonaceae bacterium]
MIEFWMWAGFFLLITVMLALDLGVLNKEAHRVSTKEALSWTVVWVSLALGFGGVVWYLYDFNKATEYITAYLIEESLSIDNLFVFVLVFRHFKVEDKYQHRVLFWGVLGAVIMRAIFIFAGVALIQQFHWVTYIFGGFLVYTGIKLFFQKDESEETEEMSEGVAVQIVKRYFSISKNFDGQKFFTIENGKKVATPLFLVLVVVEITDLIFAVDSIPAVLAVSNDAFIVFTSNIFAIMGLRSLYFLLSDVIDKFVYLKTGLSIILTFIGTKMILAGIDESLKIPSTVSLAVVAGVLLLSVIFSVLKTSSQSETANRNE